MKKTLTINLGGVVFHIDEDAYLLLNHYLEILKKHFSRQEGFQEILNDIESRIAEILGEKRPETKQVITIEDVNGVIATMGQPVEIDQEESPEMKNDQSGQGKADKRFFRNPDEKVIAGVCSGIAAYFHLDPVWVRLIFLIFLVAGGSGVLIYLVLWAVIPEAKKTSDKLEMRGEKINISNIEKSIREEMTELGTRLGSMASESAATIKRAGAGSGSVFEIIGKGIAEILRFTWKCMLILTGIILILFGLGMLLALVAYTLGWTGGIYTDNEFTVLGFPQMARLFIGCNMPVGYLQVIIFVVIGIPLFMIFYNGLRMVFRFDRVRHLGLTLFNIWVVGLFFLAWSGMRIYNLYKFNAEKQMEIALEKPSCDTLYVSLMADDPGMKYLEYEQNILVDDLKAVITDEHDLCIVPKINIEESEDSLFSITEVNHARGKSRIEAHQHLANLRFQSATSGSTLKISPFVRLPKEECWRGQMVSLIIRVPRGKFIHFEKEFHYLKPYWYFSFDSHDESTFLMTENGIDYNPVKDADTLKKDTIVSVTAKP